jgi:hypothetical protein
VPVTELALIFHVPAILALGRTLAGQHQFPLLLLVRSVVESSRVATNAVYRNFVQGRMIATVVHACGEMQADLAPFGQT